MKRSQIIARVATTFILLATGVTCADPVPLYTNGNVPRWFNLASQAWTNSFGTVVSWGDYNDGNAIAHFNHVGAQANSFIMSGQTSPFNAYGLVVNHDSWSYFDLRDQPLVIGAGGVDVLRGRFFVGYNANTEVQLSANQTWTGSGTGTALKQFNVGGTYGSCRYTRLVAKEGVTRLDITGGINATLYAPDNQLEDVTVTVSGSAKLWLIDMADARLNAKKLVMSGDGVHMPFGQISPDRAWNSAYVSSYAPTNGIAIDNYHLAPEVELANGADLFAKNGIYAISNLVVSGTAASVVSGSLLFTQAVSQIAFATAGASLAFNTTNAVAGGLAAGFSVSGSGTLSVEDISPFTGTLELLGGATFAYVPQDAGADVLRMDLTGDGTLKIDATGSIYVPSAKMSSFTGTIEVDSGRLVLDAELPAGRLVVNGGEVAYSGGLVVTDAVRSEAAITVSSNETLLVYGSGLTAATALTLAGGKVKFCASATVVAPITVTAPGSSFETAALAVTGTVSGFVTSSIPRTNDKVTDGTILAGPGCIRLTGGGSFRYKPNPLRSMDGSALFDGGVWDFYSSVSSGMDYNAKYGTAGATCGKRWTVRNNAVLKFYGYNSAYITSLYVKGHEYNYNYINESYLDIVDGGTVEIGKYGEVVAGSIQGRGTVRVANGGVLKMTDPLATIKLGQSLSAWGVIRLQDGGRIELSSPICRSLYQKYADSQPQGQFIWEGGTLKLNTDFQDAEVALFKLSGTAPSTDDPSILRGLRVWTKITGETCVLDLTDLPDRETPLANVPANYDRAEWFGTGTLTVKGGKTFVMNSFGSGLGLVLEGEGTKVVFPDGAQFHDNAICEARQNVDPGPARYSAFTDLLADVALKSFTSKGRGVKLVSENATNSLTVGSAVAAVGGEFANDTITFPGGLEVTNLTFAAGAVVGGNAAAPALQVVGDIVLPDTLCYSVHCDGALISPFMAFRASGSLTGSPTVWTNVGLRNAKPVVGVSLKTIVFIPKGMQIILR